MKFFFFIINNRKCWNMQSKKKKKKTLCKFMQSKMIGNYIKSLTILLVQLLAIEYKTMLLFASIV